MTVISHWLANCFCEVANDFFSAIARAIFSHDQFPVGERLGSNRFQGFKQVPVRFEGRRADADGWRRHYAKGT